MDENEQCSKPPPSHHLGVSKNRGTPKWMVYNEKTWKTLLKWMIWIDLQSTKFSVPAAEVLKEVQLLGFTHQHPPPKTPISRPTGPWKRQQKSNQIPPGVWLP